MNELPEALDITGAEIVQIQIRDDGAVVWVNIDGLLRLRVCQVKKVVVEDSRRRRRPKAYCNGISCTAKYIGPHEH